MAQTERQGACLEGYTLAGGFRREMYRLHFPEGDPADVLTRLMEGSCMCTRQSRPNATLDEVLQEADDPWSLRKS